MRHARGKERAHLPVTSFGKQLAMASKAVSVAMTLEYLIWADSLELTVARILVMSAMLLLRRRFKGHPQMLVSLGGPIIVSYRSVTLACGRAFALMYGKNRRMCQSSAHRG